MASVRTRPRKNHPPTYTVLWRNPSTRKQESMPFDDERDAANFARILTDCGHDLAAALAITDAVARRTPTVTVIIDEHVTSLPAATARTRADYRKDAALHITPYIGSIPVGNLTGDRIAAWLRTLAATEMSDKSIANTHGLLSAALTTAVRNGYCPGNPCKGIKLPRRSDHDDTEMRFLTRDEWARLDTELGNTLDGHYQLLFRVLAGTGMRWGELAALRVGDFSLTTNPPTVRIIRAVKQDENRQTYVGTTKTRRSKRTVSITDGLAVQIAAHTRGRASDEPVFRSRTGGPLHLSNIRSRAWWVALDAAGIEPRPRIHDLRHSHASWLLAAGVDMLTVQRRLGHESIKTTVDRYSHVLPTQQRAAADALAGLV